MSRGLSSNSFGRSSGVALLFTQTPSRSGSPKTVTGAFDVTAGVEVRPPACVEVAGDWAMNGVCDRRLATTAMAPVMDATGNRSLIEDLDWRCASRGCLTCPNEPRAAHDMITQDPAARRPTIRKP